MRFNLTTVLTVGLCSFFFTAFSQNTSSAIANHLKKNQSQLGLSDQEIKNWVIYNEHTSEKLGITYAYIRQVHQGIEVYNAVANFAMKDDQVFMTGNSLLKNLQGRVNSNQPSITQEEAIIAAATQLELEITSSDIRLLEKGEFRSVFSAEGISLETIPVKLMYFPTAENGVRLVWDLNIYTLSRKNWWSVRIDAITGELLDKADWVVNCNFGTCEHLSHKRTTTERQNTGNISELASITPQTENMLPVPPPATDQYNVFAIPVESPNHGARSLVVGPSDPIASPFGWHDDNGVPGEEYTITRGNNVLATEDMDNNNGIGYFPDGGASLNFDFPLNLNQVPANYLDPAITNLFYMNNIMHDVWYHYGFDEASGNFQENNYGNGGLGSDHVNADAQDGGGTNNANFATPEDGSNPRMQMYLWNSGGNPDLLFVNSPAGISGVYNAVEAGFGPPVPFTPITTDLVIYDDNVPDEYDACEAPVNAAALDGKIVVIRRGTCPFVDKVTFAENAGAVGVIMVNNVGGAPIVMGGTDPGIGIPSVMVSNVDGEMLIAQIESGTVNATLQNMGDFELDGDFDNGIIAHEYGHGISTRLTGGANNSNCLNNAEQMGEGWSDWFGLMLTIEPGDQSTDIRGIGTFAIDEPTDGDGIRPAPYSTSAAINNFTYGATNNTGSISQPHGIGFVWATMLWDLNWAMIEKYGFDPDVYYGTGGNNMAMHLVINALKLQPCEPGFVDGRDAILLADQLLYAGANQCLIWNVFANRGLGFSASQGSSDSRTDQTEAFDLPAGMVNSAGAESVTTCASYTWTANGQTYTSSGSYEATLTNALGCDSIATLNLTVNPISEGSETVIACNSYTWPTDGNTYNSTGAYPATLVNAQGCDSIVTLNLTINTEVTASQNITACSPYTWPVDGNTYSSTGSYQAIVPAASGCDSIITLDFVLDASASTNETVTVCEAYTWPTSGLTYTITGSYDTTLVSSTGCDSIVTLNLTVNNGSLGPTDNISVCDSYFWPVDGNTYTSSGSFSSVLSNATGCDSTVFLNLTINTVDVAIDYLDEITLNVGASGATYQWLDCDDNFSSITGETNQSYVSTSNGSYACEVTAGGCTDTTACLIVSQLGVMENNFGNELSIFPNPTFGKVTIEFGTSYDMVHAVLFNLQGQVIATKEITNSESMEFLIEGAPGFYMIELNTFEGEKAVMKVLKE